MELELDLPMQQCLKCAYVRQKLDTGPDYACPECGAVYMSFPTFLFAAVAFNLVKLYGHAFA